MRWVRVADSPQTTQIASSLSTRSASGSSVGAGANGSPRKSRSRPAQITRRPPKTSSRTTRMTPASKNCTSSMPTTLVSAESSGMIASLDRTGRAMNESPSCERTSSVPKRSSMAGLKTWTVRRAMTARFTRRMSSSLFPLNMLPTTTSSPPCWRLAAGPLTRGSGLGSGRLLRLLPVALVEALHAALDVQEVLLPGEERMALRADLDVEVRLRAHRLEAVAAGTRDGGLDVLGMDLRFHRWVSLARSREDVHLAAIVTRGGVFDDARDEREQRVVFADADVLAGQQLGAALADQDGARVDGGAGPLLHAETLPGGVAAVAGGTRSFFVCHLLCLDLRDLHGGRLRPMSRALPRPGLVLVTEDDDLLALAVGDDLTGDLRRAGRLHGIPVRHHQNVAEGDFLPRLTLEGRHGQDRSLFDAILLATAAADCVHGKPPITQKAPVSARHDVREVYPLECLGRPASSRPPLSLRGCGRRRHGPPCRSKAPLERRDAEERGETHQRRGVGDRVPAPAGAPVSAPPRPHPADQQRPPT